MGRAASLSVFLVCFPVVAAAATGTPFPAPGAAQPQPVAVAKVALADEMYGADGNWSQASLPLGEPALLMRVQSGAFCGDVGCPTAVLVKGRSGWSAAWTGMSAGTGSVLASAHHGLHDIAFNVRSGQIVLRFDGHAYVAAH